MKIAWFTPYSRKSAIARVSRSVVSELRKLCEVDLCHFDTDETFDADVPVRAFRSASDVTPEKLANYDLLVYNFGNYLPYHRDIYLLSRRMPGLAILHDFVMHHFFASYYLEELRDETGYILLMSGFYGQSGATMAREALAGRIRRVWETDEVAQFPLFEDAVRGALGVVTHSAFFREKVEAVFAGPVKQIPLAYDCDTTSPVVGRAELGIDADKILVVTVGHVNPNKTIEAVIESLDDLGSLSQGVLYAVLGPCSPEYGASLRSLVKSRNLEDSVRFLGAVSDETLRAYLSHADFCVNLRFPAFEGASASAIEEMLYGKPLIVNNIGFFAELPNECVIKVEPSRRDELTAAMRRLITSAEVRRRLGSEVREFARGEYRSDKYASAILELAAEIAAAKPMLELSDRVAAELRRMGVSRGSQVVGTIGDRMEDLFFRRRPR